MGKSGTIVTQFAKRERRGTAVTMGAGLWWNDCSHITCSQLSKCMGCVLVTPCCFWSQSDYMQLQCSLRRPDCIVYDNLLPHSLDFYCVTVWVPAVFFLLWSGCGPCVNPHSCGASPKTAPSSPPLHKSWQEQRTTASASHKTRLLK